MYRLTALRAVDAAPKVECEVIRPSKINCDINDSFLERNYGT